MLEVDCVEALCSLLRAGADEMLVLCRACGGGGSGPISNDETCGAHSLNTMRIVRSASAAAPRSVGIKLTKAPSAFGLKLIFTTGFEPIKVCSVFKLFRAEASACLKHPYN